MGFLSPYFFLFLFITLVAYYAIRSNRRWIILLLSGYAFYMTWNPWFALLLLGTSMTDWWMGSLMEKNPRRKKLFLTISIVSNLGVLVAFKYSAFLWNSALSIRSLLNGEQPQYIDNLLIPAGLSFYVFHSLSYTIDVYRGVIPAEKHPGIFGAFVSFFPQLVAGPISRFKQLGYQIAKPAEWNNSFLVQGGKLILWGYFKKIVIADRLADLVNPIFEQPQEYHGVTLLAGAFFFTVQVYCDFSGYTDIATGIARWFGIELPLNWRRPLLSRSLHEFWSRNHMTMTSWFRDYLYIPMGGSKVAVPRIYFNIFLTFLISGLWHGASWTFVIWGAMHGIVFIAERLVPFRVKWKMPGAFYLLAFHSLSMIAFRSQDFAQMCSYYKGIFSTSWDISTSWNELTSIRDTFPLVLALIGIAILFLKEIAEENNWQSRIASRIPVSRPVFYVLLFLLVFTIGQFSANEFIYFHF